MWLFLWPILLPLWLWKRGNVGRFIVVGSVLIFLCLFVSTLLPSNKAQERKTVTPTTNPPVSTESSEAISRVGKLQETAEAPRTPIPTDTPVPTNTPEPTNTLEPTNTPEPINTPRPTSAYAEMEDAPPEMEVPSNMPAPTAVPERLEPVPAPSPATQENVAIDKPSIADSEQVGSGHSAAKGNDDSAVTRWCASDAGPNHWWMVDLGAPSDLTATEVMWEFGDKVYRYKVETSAAGHDWLVVADKTGNTRAAQTQRDNFTAQGRYVRITVTGLAPTAWASFFEFSVFGSPAPTPTPTPSPAPTITPMPATAAAVAQATKVAYACLNASYVADVTVPDGTRFDADVSFVKTWRVKNTAKCDWKQDVVIAFESGDKLDGLSVVPVGALPVGKQVEVSVPMRSPLKAGKYAGAWRMQDGNGRFFGEKLSVLIGVGGPVSAPRPANTAAPTRVPAPQALSFRDGLMIVGADITPGTYRSIGGNSCYWERLRGFGGTFDEIIANDNVVGPTIVTIAATDKGFKSSRCNRWTQDLSPITSSPTAPFSDGAFMVNMDIAPGTWRSSGNGGCYWERLRGFSGEFADIIANDNVSEPTVVTISPEEAGFSSTRCGTWTKIQ
jgi:hypothetical protein